MIVSNTAAHRILGLAEGVVLNGDKRAVCRDPDQTEMLRSYLLDAARTAMGQAATLRA